MASTPPLRPGTTPIRPQNTTPTQTTTPHSQPQASSTQPARPAAQKASQRQLLPLSFLKLEDGQVTLTAINDDPVLEPRGAAIFLGVTVECLKKWRYRGQGPNYIQYGENGPVRYRLRSLIAYRAAMTVRILDKDNG